jgi:hypothetical protein
MNIKDTLAALIVITLSVALANGITYGVAFVAPPQTQQSLGSASDNVLGDSPTATRVFVKSTDTTVVATSSGRAYLSLDNASGATTTPQGVWCNFGDRAATLYSGFALFPTTTKTFTLDNLYRGAIHCIAPANGALITVTDF